jgi:hypothetical protein
MVFIAAFDKASHSFSIKRLRSLIALEIVAPHRIALTRERRVRIND